MVGVGKRKSKLHHTKNMLPKITNKQQEILKYIYHFRFLNRIQIQALLKHKDYHLINTWLKDLTEKEYLNRIYSTKFIDNTKPAVYYIGKNGIDFIKTIVNCPKEQIKKLHREKDRSEHFAGSCQLLAHIYLELRSKSDDETKYKVTTCTSFSNPDSPYNFLLDTTSNLVIEKESKGMKKYYLLEIFEPTLPLHSTRKRIKDYFDLYFSNSWENNTQELFPTLLLVCPTTPALISTKRFAKKLLGEYEDIDLKIQFETEQDVRGSNIFD